MSYIPLRQGTTTRQYITAKNQSNVPSTSVTDNDIMILKAGWTTSSIRNGTGINVVDFNGGLLYFDLNAVDTDTLGTFSVYINPGAFTDVKVELLHFNIMTAEKYDVLYGADGQGKLQIEQLSSISITGNEPGFITRGAGSGKDIDAVEIDNLATQNSDIVEQTGYILDDTNIIKITTDTIKTQTDSLEGGQTNLAAQNDQIIADIAEIEIEAGNLTDSVANKTIIAESFKEINVSAISEVSGSIFKVLNDQISSIFNKLPGGNISGLDVGTLFDGVTLSDLYQILMSGINAKFLYDPETGNVVFYKRDGVTILYTVNLTTNGRTLL